MSEKSPHIRVFSGPSVGITFEEAQSKIKKLDRYISRTQSRIERRKLELTQALENMTPKEKELMKQGMSILNLDSKSLDA